MIQVFPSTYTHFLNEIQISTHIYQFCILTNLNICIVLDLDGGRRKGKGRAVSGKFDGLTDPQYSSRSGQSGQIQGVRTVDIAGQ